MIYLKFREFAVIVEYPSYFNLKPHSHEHTPTTHQTTCPNSVPFRCNIIESVLETLPGRIESLRAFSNGGVCQPDWTYPRCNDLSRRLVIDHPLHPFRLLVVREPPTTWGCPLFVMSNHFGSQRYLFSFIITGSAERCFVAGISAIGNRENGIDDAGVIRTVTVMHRRRETWWRRVWTDEKCGVWREVIWCGYSMIDTYESFEWIKFELLKLLTKKISLIKSIFSQEFVISTFWVHLEIHWCYWEGRGVFNESGTFQDWIEWAAYIIVSNTKAHTTKNRLRKYIFHSRKLPSLINDISTKVSTFLHQNSENIISHLIYQASGAVYSYHKSIHTFWIVCMQ